ncbi:Acid ceramidase [Trichinella zimbabwensis]|uniref:Acid ceramidase n=1 Tax=Trichinella zimbabwensis TaxID=268475 RepID=A0A0V1GWP7_9BILA|nr:Acid ceramidase [Trichinella zimbabwensis]
MCSIDYYIAGLKRIKSLYAEMIKLNKEREPSEQGKLAALFKYCFYAIQQPHMALPWYIFTFLHLFIFSNSLPPPYTAECLVGNGQPLYRNASAPTFTVDLNVAAEKRWSQIANNYKFEIAELTEAVRNLTRPVLNGKFTIFIQKFFGKWIAKLPHPYREEIIGIAQIVNVPVAEDANGNMYAARNLDFGMLLGWDSINHDWTMTEILRKLVININWKRDGKLLYKSAGFAGFIGVLTAVKPGKFTISINERFSKNGGFIGILEWILKIEQAKWVTWLTREVMENADHFQEAVFSLSVVHLMAPVYFIVSGSETGEGAVITRSREEALDVRNLDKNKADLWYLLQTNYDPWETPSPLDDRRTPGKQCMDKLGKENVSFDGLYAVLSSKPVLNKMTVFTSLMQATSGALDTQIQKCNNPCWPI